MWYQAWREFQPKPQVAKTRFFYGSNDFIVIALLLLSIRKSKSIKLYFSASLQAKISSINELCDHNYNRPRNENNFSTPLDKRQNRQSNMFSTFPSSHRRICTIKLTKFIPSEEWKRVPEGNLSRRARCSRARFSRRVEHTLGRKPRNWCTGRKDKAQDELLTLEWWRVVGKSQTGPWVMADGDRVAGLERPWVNLEVRSRGRHSVMRCARLAHSSLEKTARAPSCIPLAAARHFCPSTSWLSGDAAKKAEVGGCSAWLSSRFPLWCHLSPRSVRPGSKGLRCNAGHRQGSRSRFLESRRQCSGAWVGHGWHCLGSYRDVPGSGEDFLFMKF